MYFIIQQLSREQFHVQILMSCNFDMIIALVKHKAKSP